MVFNKLDGDFSVPYIIDTIPKSLDARQLITQAKNICWIIDISGE